MLTVFELWDTEAGNLVGTYASEEAALDAVREAIATWGRSRSAVLALGVTDENGNLERVASGIELIERALVATSDRR